MGEWWSIQWSQIHHCWRIFGWRTNHSWPSLHPPLPFFKYLWGLSFLSSFLFILRIQYFRLWKNKEQFPVNPPSKQISRMQVHQMIGRICWKGLVFLPCDWMNLPRYSPITPSVKAISVRNSVLADQNSYLENEGDFDHELLSSMGISNAKERLTILKWVKQHIGEKEEKKKERQEREKEKEKEKEKEPEKQKNEAAEITVYLVKADFDLFIFILEVTNLLRFNSCVSSRFLLFSTFTVANWMATFLTTDSMISAKLQPDCMFIHWFPSSRPALANNVHSLPRRSFFYELNWKTSPCSGRLLYEGWSELIACKRSLQWHHLHGQLQIHRCSQGENTSN